MSKKQKAAAPPPPPDTLFVPGKCIPDVCGLELRPWSGMDHWRCDRCGFSTFEKNDAVGRRPSLGNSG